MRVGIMGGTGALGRGLARRFAGAGHEVVLGSRDPDRARDAAESLGGVEGAGNRAAVATTDVAVLSVPYEAQDATVRELADVLAGRVLVHCVNALGFDGGGPFMHTVPAGSAAEACAALVPDARVVGAFQNISAVALDDPDATLGYDVLLTSDDDDAADTVAALVDSVPGLRALRAGPLRLSAPIEQMTAVLISVNRRYKARAGLRLVGVEVGS